MVLQGAGQHLGEPVDRQPDAMIGDPILLVVVGADLLTATTSAHLSPPLLRQLGVALPLGELEQPGA